MESNFMYDDFSDRLTVFNGDEKVVDNIVVGDYVISLSKGGNVIGLEIIGISNVLRDYEINTEILNNLKNVELKAVSRNGAIYIFFNLESEIDMKSIKQKIPLIVSID